jgi:TonB family protein
MAVAWKKLEGQAVSGKFHVRQHLGGSEHAGVFLTELDKGGEQKAAIKLIPLNPATAELQLSRWSLAAKLSHPNLIRLFESGRCRLGGTEFLYIVMDYAEEDLSQILPQRALTPVETRDMLGPTLAVLSYLHGKGFVHGHIKPANIMAHEDQLKLSSDGICRMSEPWSGLRHPSPYDPPESIGSRAATAGDVWSFGMTLVEVLTQQLPYWEPTRQADPDVPPAVPALFQDIARHCLRRDPQLRWTVAEIAARLDPAAAAAAAAAAPKTQTATASRKSPGVVRYLVPALAGAFVLAAIIAVPRLLSRRGSPPATAAAAHESPRAEAKAKAKSPAPAAEGAAQKPAEKKQTLSNAVASSGSSAPAPLLQTKMPAGDHVPGEVLQQVLPDVSDKARSTIWGTVRVGVKLFVDSSGNVTGATLDSPGASKYFAGLALNAARKWEFAPPKVDGQPVASQWLVRFHFTNTATNAFPQQTAP